MEITNKIHESFKIFSECNCVWDGVFYTYEDILNKAKTYENLSGLKVISLLPKGVDYISLITASLLYEFTIVPLDEKWPQQRIDFIIEEVGADVLVSKKEIIKFRKGDLNKDIAYVIYTSGSTGSPKGVMIKRNELHNVIYNQVKEFQMIKENIFLYVNVCFDAIFSDILCSLVSGSCLFIKEDIKTKFKKLEGFISDYNISYLDAPPSILKFLDFDKLNVKILVVGGENSDFNLLKKISKKTNVFNVYGPTEFSICTSIKKIEEDSSFLSVGKPIDSVYYEIIDNELYISGMGMAKGYVNNDLTKERFVENQGVIKYKTGDIFELTNGEYVFKGRKDSQIKNKGQLVDLNELEITANSHPKVSSSFSFFNGKDIFLFIETESEFNILDFLKEKLPSYMLPKHMIFRKNFYKNSNDKIDRKRILKDYDFYLSYLNNEIVQSLPELHRNQNNEKLKIAITGANGFLGVHIVEQLQKRNKQVVCLLRGENPEQKMTDSAKRYGVNLDFKKLEILQTDLSLENLGLDKDCLAQVDRIIHCAAKVNNLDSYESLYGDNVLSSYNVVKTCLEHDIYLDYISTLSVDVSKEDHRYRNVAEEPLTANFKPFVSGYASSKWQAEEMVIRAKTKGLKASVYRLGLLTEDFNKNYKNDKSFVYLTCEKIRKQEKLPDIKHDLFIDISPVVWVAEDLAQLLEYKEQKIYNMSYNIKLSYKNICNFFNKQDFEDSENWFKREKGLLSLFLGDLFFNKKKNFNIFETSYIIKFENKNMLDKVGQRSIDCDIIKKSYLSFWSKP